MKRKKMWIILAMFCVAIVGYFWWRSSQLTAGTVRYVTNPVEKGSLSASVSGSGNIIVDQQATIDPTITGTVSNLSISVGDTVKKGQVLFIIVNNQLDVSLANALVSLKQARNSVTSAHISKDQARDSYNTRTGTSLNKKILKEKIAVAKENIIIAEQDLVASELSYQKALEDSRKRRVTSPIDGTVNEINIKNGDDLANISSGSSKVTPMIIGDLSTVKASVSVNEVDISKVLLGQKAMVKFSALDEVSLSGKVEKMDSLGTISSGVVTYLVTIGFEEVDSRIRPGMSVSASIIHDVKSDALLVPNGALKSDADGSYVQVLKNNIPKRKAVEVGISNSMNTEIVSGLSEGDRVVTKTVDPNISATAQSAGGGLRLPGLGGGMHRD